MIKVLTPTEHQFLKDFLALVTKYNLFIAVNEKEEIEIIINGKRHNTEECAKSDLVYTPINLGTGFDHEEIQQILRLNDERIKQIADDYKIIPLLKYSPNSPDLYKKA